MTSAVRWVPGRKNGLAGKHFRRIELFCFWCRQATYRVLSEASRTKWRI
jgi:hypothetical protein